MQSPRITACTWQSEEHHKVVFASTKSLINDSVGCWAEATIVGPRGNK